LFAFSQLLLIASLDEFDPLCVTDQFRFLDPPDFFAAGTCVFSVSSKQRRHLANLIETRNSNRVAPLFCATVT